jgi:urease accessory protein
MVRAIAIEQAGLHPHLAARVLLGYEARYRRRGRLITDIGENIVLDLPEAAELPDGGVLVLEDGRRVEIVAASEPLAEIRGASLPRLAWHIGNRHTPCDIRADRLLIQRDHVLEEMIRRLGGTVSHVEAPFRPEGGAYGHGRVHGHAHAAHAGDDPNAHIPHRHG